MPPDIFFKTDLDHFASYWDWLLGVRNPFARDHGHFWHEPAFFGNEVEIYTLALLTFTHAHRHGSRYVWLWCVAAAAAAAAASSHSRKTCSRLAILWHGLTVELVSYWVEPIDSFWHAQSTLVWFGRREPTQIALMYPSYLYLAAMVAERCNVSELTQACLMGLFVVIIDSPYEIVGVKTLMWTWHDTDSNVFDRSYWVPFSCYYFHAAFASSFNVIYNKARRHFVGLSGTYSADKLERTATFGLREIKAKRWMNEFKAAACAGLFSMPVGILQFIPLFHYFRDVWKVHAEVTWTVLVGVYLIIGFYGVNHARPLNMLEAGQREERKGVKRFGKGRWYVDEIVVALLLHFTFYMCLVTFAHPETYQVYGLHQEVGSPLGSGDKFDCGQTRNVTYPYPLTENAFPSFLRATNWFANVTVSKRPFLCPDLQLQDEGYFNFNCPKARNQTLVPGQRFYWICGTAWDNDGKGEPTSHVEYILVIWLHAILGMHALIQPLIYPRTLFEQFFVKREFPRYFKFDKPPRPRKTCIVDYRVNPHSGKEELLVESEEFPAPKWIVRSEFEQSTVGPVYAERGGLFGQMHDIYGKSSLDRTRTFVGLRHATDRLQWLDVPSTESAMKARRARSRSKSQEL